MKVPQKRLKLYIFIELLVPSSATKTETYVMYLQKAFQAQSISFGNVSQTCTVSCQETNNKTGIKILHAARLCYTLIIHKS
jgi:hypothetical protein